MVRRLGVKINIFSGEGVHFNSEITGEGSVDDEPQAKTGRNGPVLVIPDAVCALDSQSKSRTSDRAGEQSCN